MAEPGDLYNLEIWRARSILGRDFKYPETLAERTAIELAHHISVAGRRLIIRCSEDKGVISMSMDESKTAVLLLRENPQHDPDPYRMEELRGLADAAGYQVLAEISQRRGRDHRFQIGRGKIEEALGYQPEKLIFYNPLSPNQVFNIRAEFSAQVSTGSTSSWRSSPPVRPPARQSCRWSWPVSAMMHPM